MQAEKKKILAHFQDHNQQENELFSIETNTLLMIIEFQNYKRIYYRFAWIANNSKCMKINSNRLKVVFNFIGHLVQN